MTSRKQQQADLLIQFGELIAPMEELVAHPSKQTAQTRARASAKFTHDRDAFQKALNAFTSGEAGHDYKVEFAQVSGNLNRFTNQMALFRDDPEKLASELTELRQTAANAILAIPCELESEVLEAGSPFTTFMALRSLCETAAEQLIFVDPYMGQGAVRRYFHNIAANVSLTVITKRRGTQEFRDFLDVSKLYADERGPSLYRVMYHADLHDRYLQSDDAVYHLGGSLKDAGRKSDYTVTRIKAAAGTSDAVASLIQTSNEVFGPTHPVHPTP